MDPTTDQVFAVLCATADFLESIQCPYFLSGGTLLGALREQDIIAHDKDFDLDCFSEDRDRILAASHLLAAHDLTITAKEASGYEYPSGKAVESTSDASCLYVRWKGLHLGDIFPFTRFSDGVARRFHPESGTLYNAKMSIPTYFYSGNETLRIRNRSFSTPRHPELLVTRNYGPDWRIPLRSGEFPPGTNQTSGEILDSDIETLALHAVANDPTHDYTYFPAWPAPVHRTNSKSSVGWIHRHEPALRENSTAQNVLQKIWEMDEKAPSWKRTSLVRTYAYFVYRDELRRLAEVQKASSERLQKTKLASAATREANKRLKDSNKSLKKAQAKLHTKYATLHSKASRVSKHIVFRMLARGKAASALKTFLAKNPPSNKPVSSQSSIDSSDAASSEDRRATPHT